MKQIRNFTRQPVGRVRLLGFILREMISLNFGGKSDWKMFPGHRQVEVHRLMSHLRCLEIFWLLTLKHRKLEFVCKIFTGECFENTSKNTSERPAIFQCNFATIWKNFSCWLRIGTSCWLSKCPNFVLRIVPKIRLFFKMHIVIGKIGFTNYCGQNPPLKAQCLIQHRNFTHSVLVGNIEHF